MIAPGTYAVTFDADTAAATLGGDHADRPRVGDTVVVTTSVAAAVAATGTTAGKAVILPPPVVLVGAAAVLSLAHRVRVGAAGDLSAVPGPLRAEPVPGAADPDPAAAGALPAVGFAAWRAGPVLPAGGLSS